MRIFAPKNQGSPTQHLTGTWDESLYRCLFARYSNIQKAIGYQFTCRLNRRETEYAIRTNEKADHTYHGTFKLWLSDSTYCEIPVALKFEIFSNQLCGTSVKDVDDGLFLFGRAREGGRSRPAMHLFVTHSSECAEEVARLFVESKVAHGPGVEMHWRVDLCDLAGSSAHEVWPEWEGNEYDENGNTVSTVPKGWAPRSVQDLRFTAII